MSRVGSRALVAITLALAFGAGFGGCYDNVGTPLDDAGFVGDAGPILPGLEPWEAVNVAERPAPVAGDACPEAIRFARVADYMRADAVHARACIHAPMVDVWRAIQNPQTAATPATLDGWSPLPAPEHFPQCDGAAYETHLFVDDIVDVDFYLCWRHQLVLGTEAEPLLTATRWQKVFGTSAITRLEGSILAHPLEADPTITELEYQYHLNAAASDYETIETYLSTIYQRMRDDAHGIPIDPAP
jgi:hypothetical protein